MNKESQNHTSMYVWQRAGHLRVWWLEWTEQGWQWKDPLL
jgi:hypothetical protein